MNICVLRLRKGKKKKDYRFGSISDAAIFETTFFSKEESKKVTHEVLFKEIPETKYLLQELSRDPAKYSEKEFIKWFYPEKVPGKKKKSGE